MRKPIAIAIATGIAVVSLVGFAGAANADTLNSVIKRPTTSYTGPSDRAMPVHHLEPGTEVRSLCFTEGESVDGSSTWFRITKDGNSAYVARDAISVPADLRHC